MTTHVDKPADSAMKESLPQNDALLASLVVDYDAAAVRFGEADRDGDHAEAAGDRDGEAAASARQMQLLAAQEEILRRATLLKPVGLRGYIHKAALAVREPESIAGYALCLALREDIRTAGALLVTGD